MPQPKPIILIIDSTKVARNCIKMLLEPYGKVMYTDDCASAEALMEVRPALVILEYSDRCRTEAEDFMDRHCRERMLLFSTVNVGDRTTIRLGAVGAVQKPGVGELREQVAEILSGAEFTCDVSSGFPSA